MSISFIILNSYLMNTSFICQHFWYNIFGKNAQFLIVKKILDFRNRSYSDVLLLLLLPLSAGPSLEHYRTEYLHMKVHLRRG